MKASLARVGKRLKFVDFLVVVVGSQKIENDGNNDFKYCKRMDSMSRMDSFAWKVLPENRFSILGSEQP